MVADRRCCDFYVDVDGAITEHEPVVEVFDSRHDTRRSGAACDDIRAGAGASG